MSSARILFLLFNSSDSLRIFNVSDQTLLLTDMKRHENTIHRFAVEYKMSSNGAMTDCNIPSNHGTMYLRGDVVIFYENTWHLYNP